MIVKVKIGERDDQISGAAAAAWVVPGAALQAI